MGSVSSSFILFLCFLSTISLGAGDPLCHFATGKNYLSDSVEGLRNLVSFSLDRARHLKNPGYSSTTSVQLISNVFGAYTIPLNFGTPSQTSSFVMDTGSNFVWSPCTSHYSCKNCSNLLRTPTSKIQTFIPKMSSSSKVVSCKNPKCSWLHPGLSQCDEDNRTCSPYFILYGSGSTGGVPITDILRLKGLTVPNFLFGCSVVSTGQAAGIAGFGRGLASLPSQLNLIKFSYCSFSFKSINNQSSKNSVLLDYTNTRSDRKTNGMMYTPFIKNPQVGIEAYLAYYYIGLRRITLGGQHVKIPYKFLAPSGVDGNGGTVIDSGSSFSFMSRGAYKPLSDMLISQMKARGYGRNIEAEGVNGIGPCFDIPDKQNVSFPSLHFHFKGGTEISLPEENYMASVGTETTIVCLGVVTDQGGDEGGPGIILGNFQMQNYYVEFDLENERLGFQRDRC